MMSFSTISSKTTTEFLKFANAEQTETAILAIDRYATSKKCSPEAAIMLLKHLRVRVSM